MNDIGARRGVRSTLAKLGSRVAQLWSAPRNAPPPRAEVGGPLDTINDQFHDAYEQSRTEARREVPVFVVLADELVLFHDEQRTSFSFAPRAFHVIKSVTHAPLAMFAALQRLESGVLDASAQEQLAKQQKSVAAALERVERDGSDVHARTRDDLRLVLQACAAFLAPERAQISHAELLAFARPLGPALLRLADDATQLQLDALHAHVQKALGALTREERTALQVVVAGDHQARARSLAMQYFQKRLREPTGHEQRVTYAEGVSDERSALALVGTRRLDHALGQAFFGDQHRLQRDILGDSAHARLEASELAPIE